MNGDYLQSGITPQLNTGYPMGNMQGSTYAAPLNYNQPKEVVGGYDAKINPMTGQEIPEVNFAGGGNVKSEAGLASLLASHGRSGDTMLVHMAPEEVRGLQALALAHGGSLTINPETGLYEASFLKRLLPTLIGAILTPLTGGLINPMTAGLLVGGVETIRTGDIGRGLMAGLGAYGGAGLSTALAGTGAAAGAGAGEVIKTAGVDAATKAAAEAGATQATIEAAKQEAMRKAAEEAVKAKTTSSLFGGLPKNVASFSNIGKGFQTIASESGLGGIGGLSTAGTALGAAFPSNIGRGAALMGASSALTPEMEVPEGGAYNIDDSYYQSYGYDPQQGRFLGGQWRKGYPGFPPGMAEGGEVSKANEAQALRDYMAQLNQFVTSPISTARVDSPTAPPRAAPPPPPPPPAGIAPPGAGDTYVAGGGDLKWDPAKGQFVSVAPQGGPIRGGIGTGLEGIDLSSIIGGLGGIRDIPGIASYLQNARNPNWDPSQGRFVEPQAPIYPTFVPAPESAPTTTPTPAPFPVEGRFDTYQPEMPDYYGLGASGMDPSQGRFVEPQAPIYPTFTTAPEEVQKELENDPIKGYRNLSSPVEGQFAAYQPEMPDYYGLGALTIDQPLRGPSFAMGGPIQRAAGGKLITGDGDGMSDDIRANISGNQEARLADGEFVIPADVVSHLGNGSTDAGADRLYAMMDKVRKARTGRTRQAPEIDAEKYLPA